MARKKQPAQRQEIVEEDKGKTYRGQFYVEGGVVTVEAMSKHGIVLTHSELTGGWPAEGLARSLLRELIDAGRVNEC